MQMVMLLGVLALSQIPGEVTSQAADDRLKAVLERAAKEPDFDAAGLILFSAFSDESLLRSAYLSPAILDERSIFILFEGDWGTHIDLSWVERQKRRRIMIESISAKPELIRSALRADRYETFHRKRNPGGAATITSFPFFSHSPYADDLAETFIESLRRESSHPAADLKSVNNIVLISAGEMESNLLATWQMLCGLCNRLDLIETTKAGSWRDRFRDLDRWFQENRPYILWEDGKSCIRIDAEAKAVGRPTPRKSRSIPELIPPWRSVR